ncbi:hypothetical protein LWI28_009413 [Acer negundo]|uniref:Uncharacterized protein n=1 Tax=Acer negundo TaxID=4023 RepID=A0AAD5IY93_ACENE|nr:hypothetical protein LWI28_009413 [Acer negundo]
MEKYFRNAYRGDPGVPQADPYRFYNMWIGSTVFSALTWSNPYMWQLSTQLNWHDKREFSLSVANCKGTRGSRTDHLTFHAVIQELKQSVSSVHMARKDLKCFTKLAQSSHVKE